jgi:DMSO/TMAO reductase YedYZ molybdopterin-dependent catalytic subunit
MMSRPGRCTSTAARSWPGRGDSGAGLIGGKAQAQDAWDLTLTSYDDATSYNNFYEFGTDKGDPARHAHQMTTAPWSIEIDGMVDNPGTYSLEDVVAGQTIEERIYRLRCVERWSMVIPWNGFELADLLERVGVQDGARYVAFRHWPAPRRCRACACRSSSGPIRKVCVSMRPCIR